MPVLTDKDFIAVLSLNDLIHVVDVDDLTGSPQGTSKRMTLTQLKSIVDSDNQNLSNVLAAGFATGPNPIEISSGQHLQSHSGGSATRVKLNFAPNSTLGDRVITLESSNSFWSIADANGGMKVAGAEVVFTHTGDAEFSLKGAGAKKQTFDASANTDSRTYTLQNANGTVAFLSDITNGIYTSNDTIGTNRVATLTDTFKFSKSTESVVFGSLTEFVAINFAHTVSQPLSFFQNRVGGAINSDNFCFDYYFNDSNGDKTLAGSLVTKVSSAPTVGNVDIDFIFNNNFKIQSNNRVLIADSIFSKVAVAQFEVRGSDSAPTANPAVLFVGRAASTRVVLRLENESGDNLFQAQSNAKIVLNEAQLSTGDFNAKGVSDPNTLYVDSSADNVGFGTSTPLEKIHSTGKIRSDISFNLNGTDGLGAIGGTTYTIAGGGVGDLASITFRGGILTAITLVP